MKKIVVIAAAGKGNRLGKNKPKCLVKLHGHYIFEYLLQAFGWADEIRMVVGYKKDEVKAIVGQYTDKVVFVDNDEYSDTTTLQSNYMAIKEPEEKLLFIDGDMVITKDTSIQLKEMFEKGENFIGGATDISEQPVYVGVQDGMVEWFSYEKVAGYEWANVALLDASMIEYNKTHFFVQIEKYLPMKLFEVERLEVDTPSDYQYACEVIEKFPEKYNYWI